MLNMVELGNQWQELLKDEWEKPYYTELRKFLIAEYSDYKIYPSMYDMFNALKTTSYENVKAVILGQDPYHNEGQAHGMCFSVQPGVEPPPSLKNIYKEIHAELGIPVSKSGYLLKWAQQGVLLLNTVLTVREHQPLSHKGKGWETLTDKVISLLNEREEPIVFLLWGAQARAKKALITNPRHYILEAPHPSPLSANYGFFGCGHFKKTNEILEAEGKTPIDWSVE